LGTIWEVPDALWEKILPMLPEFWPRKRTGRRTADWQALNVIIFRMHTGCQWEQLPRQVRPQEYRPRLVPALVRRWRHQTDLDGPGRGCEELSGVDWRWQNSDASLGKTLGRVLNLSAPRLAHRDVRMVGSQIKAGALRSGDTEEFLNSTRLVKVSCLECAFRGHISVVAQSDHDLRGDSIIEYQQGCSNLAECGSMILTAHNTFERARIARRIREALRLIGIGHAELSEVLFVGLLGTVAEPTLHEPIFPHETLQRNALRLSFNGGHHQRQFRCAASEKNPLALGSWCATLKGRRKLGWWAVVC
jgi:hypothetical protein